MRISYRAIVFGLNKPKKCAKQPPDSKYLHIQVINRIATR